MYHVVPFAVCDIDDVTYHDAIVVSSLDRSAALKLVREMVSEGDARIWRGAGEEGSRPEWSGDQTWYVAYVDGSDEELLTVLVTIREAEARSFRSLADTESYFHKVASRWTMRVVEA